MLLAVRCYYSKSVDARSAADKPRGGMLVWGIMTERKKIMKWSTSVAVVATVRDLAIDVYVWKACDAVYYV